MTIATFETDIRAACRAKLAAMEKAALTSTGLSFSGKVITRASGSFLTDGFDEGDTLSVAGAATAANNGSTRITAVTALTLTTTKSFATEVAGASVTLTAKAPEVAYEGRAYTPTPGVPYVSESIVPAFSEPSGIGQPAVQHHSLVVMLVLFYPANRGMRPVSRMAGAILTAFRPGTSISYGDSAGMVMRAERHPAQQDADWLRCPVAITVDVFTDG